MKSRMPLPIETELMGRSIFVCGHRRTSIEFSRYGAGVSCRQARRRGKWLLFARLPMLRRESLLVSARRTGASVPGSRLALPAGRAPWPVTGC
jgi:hypothetical protein